MGFWDLSDGQEAKAEGTFDAGGGNIEPIPNETDLLAAIEDAKWDEYEGEEFIKLKWRVMRPDAYNNRVLFQKVKVMDPDPQKADRAKQMLRAIDFNAGGKLGDQKPTDEALVKSFIGKSMMVKVLVWEIDDKLGNWICAVAPKPAASATAKPAAPAADDIDDDSIPF